MHCQACGAELPADARFCIECGATIGAAATGATVQLPRQAAALACPSCGAANPDYAIFCVRCGLPMAGEARASAPQSAMPRGLTRPVASRQARPRGRRRHGQAWEGATAALFLVGLLALFLLKLPFWPGILIVCGLVAFAGEAIRGRYFRGLSSVVWLFGIAFLLMMPKLWWPGMLAIMGLQVLIDMIRRSVRSP